MKKRLRSMIGGLLMLGVLFPMIAHAEQGGFRDSLFINKKEHHAFSKHSQEERVRLLEYPENASFMNISYPSDEMMEVSTEMTEEKEKASVSVIEPNVELRLFPSIFSPSIRTLAEGEILYRLDSIIQNGTWIRVATEDGKMGYVFHLYVVSNEEPMKGYIIQESILNGIYFDYGQEVELTGFENDHFVVERDSKTFFIPEGHISFTQPTDPLIVTPLHKTPDQLNVYGNPEFIPPVHMKHPPVSSRFGQRWGRLHGGTDIAVISGTPVYAVKDGTVIASVKNQGQSKKGWGNYVKLNHNETTDTLYAHLSKPVVSVGQQVKQGQLIGYSGNSGFSTGDHLHFELYQEGKRVDSYFIVDQPHLYR